MKVLSQKQMKALMEEYPDGGIVFAEYTPDVLKGELFACYFGHYHNNKQFLEWLRTETSAQER